MPLRCFTCNYLEIQWEEKINMTRKGPCPNCKTSGKTARIALGSYGQVANWLGEYAISSNSRDYTSAVIMFCALVESMLESIKENFYNLHPEVKSRFRVPDRATIEDVLGADLDNLLATAPEHIKSFPKDWADLRAKRNSFMHGKSFFFIRQADAHKAMDLVSKAIETFAWLNNHYCLIEIKVAAP